MRSIKHRRSRGISKLALLILSFILLALTIPEYSQTKNLKPNIKTQKPGGPHKHFRKINSNLIQSRIGKSLKKPQNLKSARAIAFKNNEPRNEFNFGGTKIKADKIVKAENGTLNYIKGDLGNIKDYKTKTTDAELIQSISEYSPLARMDIVAAFDWMMDVSSLLGVQNAEEEFEVIDYTRDKLGKRHIRLQQKYEGLSVWAEEAYVHIDENDNIYAFNGAYEKTPNLKTEIAEDVSKDAALNIVKTYFRQKGILKSIDANLKRKLRIPDPKVEKVILSFGLSKPQVVWLVDIYANLMDWYYIFINVETGEIVNEIKNTATGEFIDTKGVNVHGDTTHFRAFEYADSGKRFSDSIKSYYWLSSDINGFQPIDLDHVPYGNGGASVWQLENRADLESAKIYFIDPGNSWNPAAVSSIENSKIFSEYWKNVHDRNSYDDKYSEIVAVFDYLENNASWTGKFIVYGIWQNLSWAGALDVAGHEMAHAVVEHTAGLVYKNQPGALNESFADFFGYMIDRDDHYVGEYLADPGIRDMKNPDNPNIKNPQPAHYDDFNITNIDHGGVHSNSGIPNKASYMITESLGFEKAEQIYYRALSNYLNRQSLFGQLRFALAQATEDLYSQSEVDVVLNALDQVGITDELGNPESNDVEPIIDGSDWIAFINENGKIGLHHLTNDTTHILNDIEVRNLGSTYSQLTVSYDEGTKLYYTSVDGYAGYADLTEFPLTHRYSYGVYEDLFVNSPGDIWNVAINRDNSLIAFSSIYANDNYLYFLIDDEIYYLELIVETIEEGIEVNTIQYADVFDWSPNVEEPKLAFDAFHQVSSEIDTTEWWNIAEVDLTGDTVKILPFIPQLNEFSESGALKEIFDIGNVQYSSTNPDVILFNLREQVYYDKRVIKSTWRLDIFSFESMKVELGGFGSDNIGRATFSPEDSAVVVSTLAKNILKMSELDVLGLNNFESLTNAPSPAYNPRWFRFEGKITDVDDEIQNKLPSKFVLKNNYPNPFNPSTTIEYSIPKQTQVSLKVYDILGREVAQLVNEIQSAGNYKVNFDASALSSGIYFYTIRAGSYLNTKKMILIK